MAKVHQIQMTIDGVSGHTQSPPGHPNLWKALEKSTGKLKYFRSLALHIEDRSENPSRDFPSQADWKKWLCISGIHSAELVGDVKRVTLQVRRFGRSPDPMATLLQDLLVAKGFKDRFSVWLARQTEFALEEDPQVTSSAELREQILISSLSHVIQLGAKNGILQPSLEEARILKPGNEWMWARHQMPSVESVAELKDQIHYFVSQGKWSLLKRSYRVTQRAPWTESVISENVRNPSKQFSRVYGKQDATLDTMTQPMENGAPVDLIVALSKNPDTYSNLDKFRMRCENFASLLDRPLGQVIFRKSTTGIPHFDTWAGVGNHQRLATEKVDEHQTLCVVESWDKRNPVHQRRVEYFLSKVGHINDGGVLGPSEIVSGNQDWIAYLCEMLSKFNSGWSFRFANVARLTSLNASRSSTENIAFMWMKSSELDSVQAIAEKSGISFLPLLSFDLSDKVNFVDEKNNQLGEMSPREFFASNPERDQVLDLDWKIQEEKSSLFGFDRVALFPDEYLLRVAFREQSEIDWNQELKKHSSAEGMRTLLLRSNGNQALSAYRWTDGQNLWGMATARNECWMEVNPVNSMHYTVDAAIRNLISIGASLQNITAELCLAVPEKPPSAQEGSPQSASFEEQNNQKSFRTQLAALVLCSEGSAKHFSEWGIHLNSIKELSIQDNIVTPEVFVRLHSKIEDINSAPFPGFRMAGEHLFVIGPKPIYMDSGSRVLDHVSRVVSNHMTIFEREKQLLFYEKVVEALKKGWILSLRPILDGGLALALSEMCLWSRMGAQIRPGISSIELFSSAPGRFLVGVLPSDLGKFQASFLNEVKTPIGLSGGEKLLGLTLDRLEKARKGKRAI